MHEEISLPEHEARSQGRYEALADAINTIKETKEQKMGMDNVSDKVNINVGDGGGSGANMAALIAAMNSGGGDNNIPALIAAMNKGDGGLASALPALLANNNNGMNNLWPIILLALLGRGRGGLLGGDDCGPVAAASGLNPAQAAMLQTLLEGQSALRAEVPTTALETQAAIQQAISALALGTQQGFANTKDAVQASLLANLTATSGVKDSVMNNAALLQRDICDVKATVQTEACATRELVQAGTTAILSRIDRSEIDELRARADRAERAIEVNALRSQVEVNQTVNTTQAQQQGQAQIQASFADVINRLRCLEGGHNQLATAVNRTIQFGTGNVAANTNTANNAQ